MKIGFWSNYVGHGSTTTNCISVAMNLVTNYDMRVLLFSPQPFKANNLQSFFKSHELDSAYEFQAGGLDTLQLLTRSGELKPDTLGSYTTTIIPNKLDMLALTEDGSAFMSDDKGLLMAKILVSVDKCYDIVLVDVGSGYNDLSVSSILACCDVVVCNLPQTESIIKNYKLTKDYFTPFNNKKLVACLGCYDDQSKYSTKYVAQKLKLKDEVFCIPYSRLLKDNISSKTVDRFFESHKSIKPNDIDFGYFAEVDKLTKALLVLIEREPSEELGVKVTEQKSLLHTLKGLVSR